MQKHQSSHAAHQQMTQQLKVNIRQNAVLARNSRISVLLKHDVMYHHGMGGPPQRPLQVRQPFCLIIVGRRTNVLSPDRRRLKSGKKKIVEHETIKTRVRPTQKATKTNWIISRTIEPSWKRDLNVEWCIAGHVATLKRASSAVNWAVTSFNAFQFADCVNPRRHPLRISIFQSIMHSLIRLIDGAAVGKLIPITGAESKEINRDG